MACLPSYMQVIGYEVDRTTNSYVMCVRLRLWHPRLWLEIAKRLLTGNRKPEGFEHV